jgi:DnaK suppressor protein
VDHLSPDQLASLRDRLEREREELRVRVAAVTDGEDEEVELQDAAASEANRQQDIRLARRAQIRMREVDAALARMDAGTYGECEETGEPIPFGRLEIEPTTRYTVEAAEALAQGSPEGDGSRDDPGGY